MEDILYNAALTFSNVMKYDYIYTLGRKTVLKISVLSNRSYLFTHVCGLDHLKEPPVITANNEAQKKKVYKKILQKKITFSDIQDSPDLNEFIKGTYNTASDSPYTIKDRIIMLEELECILDRSFTGKMYRWDKNKSSVTAAYTQRYININADFLLVVPSERNPDEKIYLFLYQSNKNNKNEDICLHLFSAFSDCVDLTLGQEAPYTILELTKREIETKDEITLFTHPAYSKSKDLALV